jgi:hypothetical protein
MVILEFNETDQVTVMLFNIGKLTLAGYHVFFLVNHIDDL